MHVSKLLARNPGGLIVGLGLSPRSAWPERKYSSFRAKPVERVYIPKPDGRERPLGVTALEDKIVQRATVQVLNAIYEVDFKGFSHGFRPGRNPHGPEL